MHARCWQHRCVPSSTTCPRAWQAWCGASLTSSSSVYACLVLATPTRAFVYDVSPGLANLPRRVVNIIYFLAHHYFDTTARMTNSAPPCARGSTATSSTPATPTRHRPRHSSHGYLDHGYTTHALDYFGKRHKGLPPCLSNLVGLHSSHNSVMHRPLRLWGGVRRLAFGFFSSLTICIATVVTVGGC